MSIAAKKILRQGFADKSARTNPWVLAVSAVYKKHTARVCFGVPAGILPKLRKRSPLGKASSLRSSREPRCFERPNYTKKGQPQGLSFFGVPDWIRTNGTKRRRLVLYPTELRIRMQSYSILAFFIRFCKRFFRRFLFSTKKSAKLPNPRFADFPLSLVFVFRFV